MTDYRFSKNNERYMNHAHPDLVKGDHRPFTLSDIDFTVIESVRTSARQRELKNAGASHILNSQQLMGHMVVLAPLVNGTILLQNWQSREVYP